MEKRFSVYLVYVDDSSDNSDIQVIAGVIVPDDDLLVIEQGGYLLDSPDHNP